MKRNTPFGHFGIIGLLALSACLDNRSALADTFYSSELESVYPTSTTLSLTPAEALPGSKVTLTSRTAGVIWANEPVSFYLGAVKIGSARTDASSKAELALDTTSLLSGSYTVRAEYPTTGRTTRTELVATQVSYRPDGSVRSIDYYYLRYYDQATASSGTAPLTILPSRPVIATQPQGQRVATGSTVRFNVTAGGSTPFSYQWLQNEIPLLERAAQTLTLTNVGPSQAGAYSVVVSNTLGSTWSLPAWLSLFPVSDLPGALDYRFDARMGTNSMVRAVALQNDGKVLIGGSFSSAGGIARSGIARLAADGSLDESFNPGLAADTWVTAMALQGDAKVIVARHRSLTPAASSVARLNADGTFDANFASGSDFFVNAIAIQSDGKVLLAGGDNSDRYSAKGVFRHNRDGTLDPSFKPTATDKAVECLALASDGKIFIGGSFTNLNGIHRWVFARLNADGSMDTSFAPQDYFGDKIRAIAIQSDGEMLLGGAGLFGTIFNNTSGIGRMRTNGRMDAAFSAETGDGAKIDSYTLGIVWGISLQTDGKALVTGNFSLFNGVSRNGIVRLNSDGSVDTSFIPCSINGSVAATAIQNDGEVVIGGGFSAVDQTTRRAIARVRGGEAVPTVPDISAAPVGQSIGAGSIVSLGVTAFGWPLPSYQWLFEGKPIPSATNTTLTLRDLQLDQSGGYSVVVSNAVGSITSPDALLNISILGALDDTFLKGLGGPDGSVSVMAVESGGKVLIGGTFSTVNGTRRNQLARLNVDGSLDASFDPGSGIGGSLSAMAIQSDGKVLIGGQFTSVNGVTRNRVARLNVGGSLDVSFDPGAGASAQILALAVQSDGKVLVGGFFSSVNDVARSGTARLNADGSLDASFVPGSLAPGYHYINVVTIQSDGKVLIGGSFSSVGGIARNGIARLNADGSLDPGFNPPAAIGWGNGVTKIIVQPNGKVLIAGGLYLSTAQNLDRIARLNPDGSLDTGFEIASMDNEIAAVVLEDDGGILIGGGIRSIDGVARNRIARLNSDGTLDAEFNPGSGLNWGSLSAVLPMGRGKVVIGGSFLARLFVDEPPPATPLILSQTSYQQVLPGGMATLRVSADAWPRASFQWQLDGVRVPGATAAELVLTNVQARQLGRYSVVVSNSVGVAESRPIPLSFTLTGAVDTRFDPGMGADREVRTMAAQGDGKVLIGGYFSSVDGVARRGIARLNTDGSLDASFNPGTGTSGGVEVLAIQTDGKVLLGGGFSSINGVARGGIARLNTDGSLDDAFDAGSAYGVLALASQTDGKVLIGGYFNDINGTTRNKIARLNLYGSLDTVFFPPYANHDVEAIALQSDGKVLFAGTVGPSYNQRPCFRLNRDGTFDSSFSAPWEAAVGSSKALAVQSDGKVLVGGGNGVARFNTDGSPDQSFGARANFVNTIDLQPDGQVLIGGYFSQVNGVTRSCIARLNSDGSLDDRFNPIADAGVRAVVSQKDGTILIGGAFTRMNGISCARVARLFAEDPITPPVLTTTTYLGSEFKVGLHTAFGRAYTLQASTDLREWGDVRQVIGDGSEAALVDRAAAGAQRFYRVRIK